MKKPLSTLLFVVGLTLLVWGGWKVDNYQDSMEVIHALQTESITELKSKETNDFRVQINDKKVALEKERLSENGSAQKGKWLMVVGLFAVGFSVRFQNKNENKSVVTTPEAAPPTS